MRHIGICCMIDDPFDPPGHGRFGGGHVFMFELGRYLVQAGNRVTFLTRRNAAQKPRLEQLGPYCTLLRIPAGPAEEIAVEDVGAFTDNLVDASGEFFGHEGWPQVVHAQYWISGEVARRLKNIGEFRILYHPLSFGRRKRELGFSRGAANEQREVVEPRVLNAADVIVTVTPFERQTLQRLYPEIDDEKCVLVPHGVDTDVFCPRPDDTGIYVRRQTRRFLEGIEDLHRCN